ncbi:hypothetical protein [Paracoccus sanguinis]|uniref:Uncharacterized protein n=1 Tax=Paracoccus sanguinis TaxID=1545044 RepID=A0A099GKH8_9RHOB|nr:hypothetical protein [Paracoccus sanguinis]KGJ23251.1 hypothetical protein IX56_03030 [Paracoccus sanguinis]
MGIVEDVADLRTAVGVAGLSERHLRLLSRVDALVSRFDERDDYAGLNADEISVRDELRAMAVEARS